MRTSISRRILSIFTALILLATLVAASAYARTSSSLVVQIPFDFSVAGKQLPAGKYLVERSTQASAEGLSFRSVERSAGAFVLTITVLSKERQSDSRLVFHKYGDQYFLAQFWTSGETSGRELVKTDKERTVERELAKAGTKPENVAIIVTQK